MSENEQARLDKLEEKVDMINLAIQGNSFMGIEGLVPLLHRHMAESKNNLTNFKKSLSVGFAEDIDDLDKRLKPVEVSHKKRYNTLGFFTGLGVICGFGISYVWDLILPLLK